MSPSDVWHGGQQNARLSQCDAAWGAHAKCATGVACLLCLAFTPFSFKIVSEITSWRAQHINSLVATVMAASTATLRYPGTVRTPLSCCPVLKSMLKRSSDAAMLPDDPHCGAGALKLQCLGIAVSRRPVSPSLSPVETSQNAQPKECENSVGWTNDSLVLSIRNQ